MATITLNQTEQKAAAKAGVQYVYFFGAGHADGNGKMKDELGGKGAGLAEMTNAGLPVPPGFTIQTEACREYMHNGTTSPEVDKETNAALARLEQLMGKQLGAAHDPLLVSVRSGAKFSMPGMMDTILNLGLNETSLKGLIKQTSNERFCYDAYRRFIQLFGKIALNISDEHFDGLMSATKRKYGAFSDVDLKTEHLKELSAGYLDIVQRHSGKPFPQDP
jgi:pyruvate,orthophosphate dikinase